jgi:transposase InsO family protein
MVVIDRFTKYAHFLSLAHSYTVLYTTHTFLENIYKFHDLPTFIITDHDPVFTSQFWKELLKLLGIKLNISTTYHPQTDGHAERPNQYLKNYLCSMLLHQPNKWTTWLPLAQ